MEILEAEIYRERSKGEILNFIFKLKLPLAFLERVQEIVFQLLLFNDGLDETLGRDRL